MPACEFLVTVARARVSVDSRAAALVEFALPFWLLRLTSGPILFSSYASGFDDAGVSIRPEDIERPGPKTSPSPPTEPAAPLSPWR